MTRTSGNSKTQRKVLLSTPVFPPHHSANNIIQILTAATAINKITTSNSNNNSVQQPFLLRADSNIYDSSTNNNNYNDSGGNDNIRPNETIQGTVFVSILSSPPLIPLIGMSLIIIMIVVVTLSLLPHFRRATERTKYYMRTAGELASTTSQESIVLRTATFEYFYNQMAMRDDGNKRIVYHPDETPNQDWSLLLPAPVISLADEFSNEDYFYNDNGQQEQRQESPNSLTDCYYRTPQSTAIIRPNQFDLTAGLGDSSSTTSQNQPENDKTEGAAFDLLHLPQYDLGGLSADNVIMGTNNVQHMLSPESSTASLSSVGSNFKRTHQSHQQQAHQSSMQVVATPMAVMSREARQHRPSLVNIRRTNTITRGGGHRGSKSTGRLGSETGPEDAPNFKKMGIFSLN